MRDLTFIGGDIDLTWIEGAKVLSASVRRRLGTHPSSYVRAVRTTSGVTEVNLNFGSKLRQYISYPETELTQTEVSNVVVEAMAQDPTVVLKSVILQQNTVQVVFSPREGTNLIETFIG